MIEAYSQNIALAANSSIPFNSVALVKGCTSVLSGVNTVRLNKKGIYKVTFVMDAVPTADGTIIVEMLKDGVLQTQTRKTLTAVATATSTVVIDTFVQVSEDNTRCCATAPTTIQFQNLGVAVTASDITVTVTKIC